ncbi:MAG: TrbC/VirB2 family protein [Candidatus Paceibacterota bacterium]|jgi:hypothetical protein
MNMNMNINMLKKISIHVLLISLFILPVFVFADNTSIPIRITNPFKGGDSLSELITTVLNNVVMPIAAVVVVIWIVWAGFTFVMAQGNPKKIEEAQQRLLWSLIGAGILLGAAGISAVVQNTVGALIAP